MTKLLSVLSPKWVFPPAVEIPAELKSGLGVSDFLLEALARRGIKTPETARAFLDYRLYDPASPDSFADMHKAVGRILASIKQGETIGVWGDFDVDGQTSTALLVETLRDLGADPRFHIPIRSRESHGIKLPALKDFLTPSMRLLITCDTGITAHEAADHLHSLGVDLIITDHHSLPEVLPSAFAVINPHLLPPQHPLSTLAGVGVAYVLAEALYSAAGRAENSEHLHDLVALGCIADMASLTADTRYLVQSGIERIRTTPRLFLSKMASMLELPLDHLNEEHVGFYLAPRMNAVGRLEDANPMVDLLLSQDESVIKSILDRMEALNANRRVLVNQVFEGCLSQLEANPNLLDQPLLILSHPEWPAGVVGIAAGRLAELTHRPVILFSGGADGFLRGSARSVEGVDITAALTAQNDLLTSFGGHPMAAGLSLGVDALPEFRARMQQTVARLAAVSQVEPELKVEATLPLDQVTFDLLNDLDRLSPFGMGNPAPVFSASNLSIDEVIPMGKNSEHRRVTVSDQKGDSFEILWWQGADLPVPEGNLDLAYTAHLNLYKGSPRVQYEWVDARPAQIASVSVSRKPRKSVQLTDRRDVSHLTPGLLGEFSASGSLVWAEGIDLPANNTANRFQLEKNRSLVILTIPPSLEILLAGIARVKPAEITVMAVQPVESTLKGFLIAVGSFLKGRMTIPETRVNLAEVAASFAVTPEMIKTALLWYSAKGSFQMESLGQDQVSISCPGIPVQSKLPILEARMKLQWDEMTAFHRYYLTAPLTSLTGLRPD